MKTPKNWTPKRMQRTAPPRGRNIGKTLAERAVESMNTELWLCPRCGEYNESTGQDGRRIRGIECRCGLTRAGWLVGRITYSYPVEDGSVTVADGRTTFVETLCHFCDDPHCFEAPAGETWTVKGEIFDVEGRGVSFASKDLDFETF